MFFPRRQRKPKLKFGFAWFPTYVIDLNGYIWLEIYFYTIDKYRNRSYYNFASWREAEKQLDRERWR